MMDRNNIAYVSIKNCPDRTISEKYKQFHMSPVDYYVFAYDISEGEFIDELVQLNDFYEQVIIGTCPPHIRETQVVSALCGAGTQCSINCQYYQGGCTLYATK